MAKAVTLWRISAYYGIGVCTDMFFETGRIEWLAFSRQLYWQRLQRLLWRMRL